MILSSLASPLQAPFSPIRLIPLTLPEVRRLLWRLVFRGLPCLEHILHWSYWRRRHQAIARFCHYKRRLSTSSTQIQL
ncbi:MAG TPA: hypothetical protein V6D04_06665 [Candidatus Obscuribacterales bacterium]